MKTLTLTIAAILLQVNILFAGSDGVPAKASKEINIAASLFLAPETPKEATFEETVPVPEILILPVTPKEATFGDDSEDIILNGLAPVTPAEADFNDDEPDTITGPNFFFSVPGEADFDLLP